MRIVALLMAAGAATRFGACKVLTDIGGTTPLQLAIKNLQAIGIDDIRVISGAWHQHLVSAELAHAKLMYCEQWQLGLGHSIAFGATSVTEADGILVLLADQVALTKQDLQCLIEAFDGNKSVCAYYSNRRAVPAIFAKQHWPNLRRLKGDRGAQQLLNEDSEIVAIDLPHAAFDIDTKEQLDLFRAQR
ncbi:MAG TPA: nucleotidyltransferase family protein [Pseudomonadales bacterium]|nr:nucleotidyltransferase family protein [Pseudomonadales bacterium]